MTFNPDDVHKVARAVLDRHLYEDASGRNAYQFCEYCNGRRYANGGDDTNPATFKHDLDCVVLIARDLLTGAP